MPRSPHTTQPRKRLGRPRANACNTCRAAKVKCDEHRPRCSRCSRLELLCDWPLDLETTKLPYPVGARKLLPRLHLAQSVADYGMSSVASISEISPVQSLDDHDFPQMVHYFDDPGPDKQEDCRSSSMSQEPRCSPDVLDPSWYLGQLLPSSALFVRDIVLDDSLVLSGDEYHALSHYQHGFISPRLLKTPQWSTFGCILQAVSHIPMAMHFLLAISSLDLIQQSPNPAINTNTSRLHLRKGSEMLIQMMNVDMEPHHFSTLSSWYFLYLCMINRDVLDREAINRLSSAILNYVQRFNLDSFSAEDTIEEGSGNSFNQKGHSDPEIGLISRVLLFLVATDSITGFEGCGGHLANYLYSKQNVYWQVFSTQRYILERFWGSSYPEIEVRQDLEMTAALELRYKVGYLIQRVNRLSQAELIRRDPDLERLIAVTEREYSSIVRITRLATVYPRSSFVRAAEAAICSFYFVQIYYFRLTLDDAALPTPPHISTIMTEMMNIAHRVFKKGESLGHEIYQRPLFAVGMETQDQIHVEWILRKLSMSRLRTALRRIIST